MQKLQLHSSHLSPCGSPSTNFLDDSSLLTDILDVELGDPNRDGLDGDIVADESVSSDPNNAGLDGVEEGIICNFLLP